MKIRRIGRVLPFLVGAVVLFALAPVATSTTYSNGPGAFYPFDGGNANDAADSNNGTNHGATFVSDHPTSSPVNAKSASFSGNTAGAPKYIEVPDANALDASGDFSVTGWVKTTAGDQEAIVGKRRNVGGVDGRGWMVSTWQGGLLIEFTDGAGGDASILSNSTINDGNWHAFAFTKSGAGLSVYIDGVLSDSNTRTMGDVSNSLTMRMGVQNVAPGESSSGALAFNGNIDEIQIYQRALTSLQAAVLGGRVTNGVAGNHWGFTAGGIDCGGTSNIPFTGYATIQGAENDASPGNTIFVCPGTYNENVSVTKNTLQILGFKNGQDARTRDTSSSESIVNGGGGTAFDVDANDVLVDGFTLQGNVGVSQHANRSGTDADHTYFTGAGRGVVADGANFTVYQDFFNGTSTGVYSNLGASNGLIDSNKFLNGDPVFYDVGPGTTGLTISDNAIGNANANSGGPIRLADTTTATISAINSQHSTSDGIDLNGNDNGITINGNTVNLAAGHDLSIANTGPGPNNNLTVTNNTLSNSAGGYGVLVVTNGIVNNQAAVFVNTNMIFGNASGGILNDNLDRVINARSNWWGDPSGPSVWSIGTGQSVSAEVDFFPWATNNTLTTFRACDKTATPGQILFGTNASEVLCGTGANDRIGGGGGKDLILGFGGNDQLRGGAGNDVLIGDDYGNGGSDQLVGNDDGSTVDHMEGWLGSDTCSAGPGDVTDSC